eukprot:CAMPEP_0204562052 /NCGR_PEP_ID=MMETSP0661-20131031/33537_1 /ASSEMBLY_ACC=CAM_ASM_000606 /TAXON_ID=109239 /ORGANISM="Alexandrium margalefi, Strain AMGDE01CS-322" /LENGTH=159 /DNA_ID=CAMNT_0051569515 /DNA_START=152 /DNA_END=628 /DNA_ORIENTATION=-
MSRLNPPGRAAPATPPPLAHGLKQQNAARGGGRGHEDAHGVGVLPGRKPRRRAGVVDAEEVEGGAPALAKPKPHLRGEALHLCVVLRAEAPLVLDAAVEVLAREVVPIHAPPVDHGPQARAEVLLAVLGRPQAECVQAFEGVRPSLHGWGKGRRRRAPE